MSAEMKPMCVLLSSKCLLKSFIHHIRNYVKCQDKKQISGENREKGIIIVPVFYLSM